MEPNTINAIIKTLCYAEVFSYPLTFPEVSKYLISSKKISDRELLFAFSKYRNIFEEEKGLIVLKNSKKYIKERIIRMGESRKKLAKALWISQILSYIPTIQLIGISGSLSMYNAKKDDDIDFFFITSKDSLWITRFLVVCILYLLKQKRIPGNVFAKDKICPNMFITEDTLSIEKKNRNLYTAHEVAQLKILYEKNNMKKRFFRENRWVLKFMSNAFTIHDKVDIEKKSHIYLRFLDNVFYFLQKRYMKKKITTEVIQKNRASFHPQNIGNPILQIFNLKVFYRKKILNEIEVFNSTYFRLN